MDTRRLADVVSMTWDLIFLTAVTLASCLVLLAPGFDFGVLRIVAMVPLLFIAPGYLVVSILFPHGTRTDPSDGSVLDRDSSPDPDDSEVPVLRRWLYVFTLSIVLTPMIGLVLQSNPLGVTRMTIAIAIAAFVVIGGAAVTFTRLRAPDPSVQRADRFWSVPDIQLSRLFEFETTTELAVNAFLILSVIFAVALVSYGIAAAPADKGFTEFFVATSDPTGDLRIGEYPEHLPANDSNSLVVGIENHEDEKTRYTLVALIVERPENAETTGSDRCVVDRRELTVSKNERQTLTPDFRPCSTGEDVELLLLLFRGEATEPIDETEAYRSLHLTINASTTNSVDESGAVDSPRAEPLRPSATPPFESVTAGRRLSLV